MTTDSENTSNAKNDHIFCHQCGNSISGDSVFCQYCGSKIDTPNQKIAFCRKCGAMIAENDLYCKQCGFLLEPTSNENKANQVEQPSQDQKEEVGCLATLKSFFIGSVIFILVIAFTIAFFVFVDIGSATGFSFRTDATMNDVDVDYELDVDNLSFNLIIIPECNIKKLEITISFYDKNNSYLFDIEKSFGNVKKGETVNRKISLFEFDTEIFKIRNVRIKVSNGTKSVFN